MSPVRASVGVLLLSIGAAGCSSWFGGSKPQVAVNPDPFPTNYRSETVTLLRTSLGDPAEFRGALIAPPALKPVPEGRDQHYVVCLQLNSRTGVKNKAVVFLEGVPNEFVDSTPEECSGAPYQPFAELASARPPR
jgi:hypothetical protein